jgi:hypothetical protein
MLRPQVPRKVFAGRSVGREAREAPEGVAETNVSIRAATARGRTMTCRRLCWSNECIAKLTQCH